MNILKKALNYIFVIFIFIALAVILFLLITSAVRHYEQHHIIRVFSDNSALFDEFISDKGVIDYKIHGETGYTVTSQYKELGIEEIYEVDENIYFEQKHRVLGIIPDRKSVV